MLCSSDYFILSCHVLGLEHWSLICSALFIAMSILALEQDSDILLLPYLLKFILIFVSVAVELYLCITTTYIMI